MTEIICSKCKRICELSEVFTCKNKGKTSYECIDENQCNSIIKKEKYEKKKIEEEEEKKYKHLDINKKLEVKYGINIEDLELSSHMYRDGCLRYNDNKNEKSYLLNRNNKTWYKLEEYLGN